MGKTIQDLDSKFVRNHSVSEILRGDKALNNMILNLFETNNQYENSLGDRPYEPTFGCNLQRYLFDPLDLNIAMDIKDELYLAITTFMPEVFVTRNSISVVPIYDEDAYKIVVAYVYLGNPYDLQVKMSRKVK